MQQICGIPSRIWTVACNVSSDISFTVLDQKVMPYVIYQLTRYVQYIVNLQ